MYVNYTYMYVTNKHNESDKLIRTYVKYDNGKAYWLQYLVK